MQFGLINVRYRLPFGLNKHQYKLHAHDQIAFLVHLYTIEDTLKGITLGYELTDIIFLVSAAVLSITERWWAINFFGVTRLEWLS
jgi:hypothetical protein